MENTIEPEALDEGAISTEIPVVINKDTIIESENTAVAEPVLEQQEEPQPVEEAPISTTETPAATVSEPVESDPALELVNDDKTDENDNVDQDKPKLESTMEVWKSVQSNPFVKQVCDHFSGDVVDVRG